MHRYERLVLDALRGGKPMGFSDLLAKSGLGRDEALWTLESLSQNGYVELQREDSTEVSLTKEGKEYSVSALPEARLLARLKEGTVEIRSLKSDEERIGLQWAKQKGLIVIQDGKVLLAEKGVHVFEKGLPEEKVLKELAKDSHSYPSLTRSSAAELAELAKRGLIETKKKSSVARISITQKGAMAKTDVEDEGIGALTKSAIAGKAWNGVKFKGYDVNVPVEKAIPAMKHPLAQNIDDIRRAYTSNGFTEVSGPVIDSAFWVFDSLFQPQDHPARDTQDTFYLEDVEAQEIKSKEYINKVKKAHTQGWHYKWDIDTAMEPVLRTHMTSVSVRYLYEMLSNLTSKKYEFPIKLFSLGRVFRNENVDYRHLADFQQTDGAVIGKNLTFANLFDILIRLYAWIGSEIKFKPAYFPFVEPGVEIYVFSKERNEWIEIGGAGILRREITGMKRKDLSVLAWGVSVERLMMIRPNGNVNSITELYNNGLGWLRNRKMM